MSDIATQIENFRLTDEDAQKCIEFLGLREHSEGKDAIIHGPLDLPKQLELLRLLCLFRSRGFSSDNLHELVDKMLSEYDRFVREVNA